MLILNTQMCCNYFFNSPVFSVLFLNQWQTQGGILLWLFTYRVCSKSFPLGMNTWIFQLFSIFNKNAKHLHQRSIFEAEYLCLQTKWTTWKPNCYKNCWCREIINKYFPLNQCSQHLSFYLSTFYSHKSYFVLFTLFHIKEGWGRENIGFWSRLYMGGGWPFWDAAAGNLPLPTVPFSLILGQMVAFSLAGTSLPAACLQGLYS